MPGYKTHISGAIYMWSIALMVIVLVQALSNTGFFTWYHGLEWLLAALVGGQFPDVDIKSKAQQRLYAVVIFMGVIMFGVSYIFNYSYYTLAVMLLISLLPLVFNHKRIMHSWLVITGLVVVVYGVTYYYYPFLVAFMWYDLLFFWLGAMSHLWLDGKGILARGRVRS